MHFVVDCRRQFEAPKCMGIDEIHLIRPRCVISNIQNNTIVDMLVSRNKDTVINYLSNLAGHLLVTLFKL